MIEIFIPNDFNIIKKTTEKITKYRDLEIEFKNAGT